ncbi:MAG: hypothetical protein KDC78_01835 [Aequorivita sp.]|nr:hypothetical protein [Aequorivita sp.]
MMKKLLKLANIGFYILMLFACFILGLYFAGAIEAGKNQGLAGGAIVVGYGVLFGGIGFIASFFIAYFVNTKVIVKINYVLLILLLAAFGHKYYQFKERQKERLETKEQFKPVPTTPTEQTEPLGMSILNKNELFNPIVIKNPIVSDEMGMGFFAPNFYENSVLYFYGNLNLEKSLMDHTPYDSITFKRNKYNQFEIATAPPWLVPEILKMDYDMLYFKIISVTEYFIEVTVNKTNGQTTYIDRRAGQVIYWPEFLLSMNSIEFPQGSKEKIRVRSFEASGEINIPHEFMRAIQIKDEWMQVLLLDGDFKTVGKGWIQWERNGKLIVRYNLLS